MSLKIAYIACLDISPGDKMIKKLFFHLFVCRLIIEGNDHIDRLVNALCGAAIVYNH